MRRWAIILLTVVTAMVHLRFFLQDPRGGFIFLLNALGYLGLLGLLYLPIGLPRSLIRLARPALMGYAALTIVLYVIFSYQAGNWVIPLGPIDKLVELVLIALLWSEERSARSTTV